MKSSHTFTSLDDLQYYITPPHDCSYLPKRSARMVFLDPAQRIDTLTLSELSRSGFRRSGDFVYRPECHSCRQCLSARVPVANFRPNSSQKKALKNNKDLTTRIIGLDQIEDHHYQLYEQYIRVRHFDGDMYPPSYEQFEKFLLQSCANTSFLELWQDDQLMSVAACDHVDDGLSAVYTFFDPFEPKRSLGVYSILQQIEWVKKLGLDYLYLGYWVPHSHKMTYKAKYTPFEILLDGKWHTIEQQLAEDEIQRLGDSLLMNLPNSIHKIP